MKTESDRLCGIGDEAARELIDQVELHQSIGLGGLEVRTISGRLLHEMDDSSFEVAVRVVKNSRLTIPVVDTPIGGWNATLSSSLDEDLELLRIYARRARALGCTRLRIMSYPSGGRTNADWQRDSLNRIGALVKEACHENVVLIHENCSGWASRNVDSTITMLEAISDEHLKLLFDTGNGMAYAYDGFAFLSEVLPWVEHVHIKDAIMSDGMVQWVLPGDGSARLAKSLELLRQYRYQGWLSLEPHLAHIPHEGITSDDDMLGVVYADSAGRIRRLFNELAP